MKLAILDADILADPLRADYGGYGRMFQDLLRQTGDAWQMTAYSVISGVYPDSMDDYDAYLVTGSKYDSFSDEPWVVRLRDYARQLYALGKPLIGVCFGHQLLAHALGGRTGRSTAGWGLGVHTYELDHRAPFIDKVGPVRLIASHQDQVQVLPPGARPLLSNDFCPLAGFYIPRRVLTVQGHPEFTTEYANALISYRADRFPADQVAAVIASHATPHDGLRVAHWIERFVGDALANPPATDTPGEPAPGH